MHTKISYTNVAKCWSVFSILIKTNKHFSKTKALVWMHISTISEFLQTPEKNIGGNVRTVSGNMHVKTEVRSFTVLNWSD